MVSKNQIKIIADLHQKKHRLMHNMFIAEGQKCISELLQSHFELVYLLETEPVFEHISFSEKYLVTANDLKKMSALTNANNCLAVFKIPASKKMNKSGLIVALDNISDPGNLGTIIRLCDWFGITDLVCSKTTVDLYNPKVVQATMGSLSRINVSYLELETFLDNTKIPIFGTFMDGENVYQTTLPTSAILLMGSEANGISEKLHKKVTKRISIPRFGDLQNTESLNVATATAIFLSEFKRIAI